MLKRPNNENNDAIYWKRYEFSIWVFAFSIWSHEEVARLVYSHLHSYHNSFSGKLRCQNMYLFINRCHRQCNASARQCGSVGHLHAFERARYSATYSVIIILPRVKTSRIQIFWSVCLGDTKFEYQNMRAL